MADIGGANFIRCVLYLLVFASFTQSQVARGCGCLSSRLEHHPCKFRHPERTEQPGANQYGDYHTASNQCNCEIKKRKCVVASLQYVGGKHGGWFSIKSPNKLENPPRAKYRNNELTIYNINCKKGQYIDFELNEMDLEDTKCYDEAYKKEKCVDYIQVQSPQGDAIFETCGRETHFKPIHKKIHYDSARVIFRTNSKKTFKGFSASAFCVSHNYDDEILRLLLLPKRTCSVKILTIDSVKQSEEELVWPMLEDSDEFVQDEDSEVESYSKLWWDDTHFQKVPSGAITKNKTLAVFSRRHKQVEFMLQMYLTTTEYRRHGNYCMHNSQEKQSL